MLQGVAQETVLAMGWLRKVGSLKLQVSFAKEPYKINYILQKKPIILRSLLIVATPYDMYFDHCPTPDEVCNVL